MTIQQIALEADKLHLSYGKYVSIHNPTAAKPVKPAPTPKLCQLCHRPIVGKCGQARYCHECAQGNRDRLMQERTRRRKEQTNNNN